MGKITSFKSPSSPKFNLAVSSAFRLSYSNLAFSRSASAFASTGSFRIFSASRSFARSLRAFLCTSHFILGPTCFYCIVRDDDHSIHSITYLELVVAWKWFVTINAVAGQRLFFRVLIIFSLCRWFMVHFRRIWIANSICVLRLPPKRLEWLVSTAVCWVLDLVLSTLLQWQTTCS